MPLLPYLLNPPFGWFVDFFFGTIHWNPDSFFRFFLGFSPGGVYLGHSGTVLSCAMSLDGSRVASCSEVVTGPLIGNSEEGLPVDVMGLGSPPLLSQEAGEQPYP